MKDRPYFHIHSLEKAARIMDLLAQRGELSVSEISKSLGMHRSATHRFLATLRNLGYLDQSEDATYRLSFKLFELGISVANRLEIRNVVHPFLMDMTVRHEETSNLGILEGLDVIYIDKIESPHLLRTDLAIGCRVPSYCTALGKVLLANRPEKEIQKLLRTAKVELRTPGANSKLPDSAESLRRIRDEGYAIDDEELSPGIRCVAVPLFNFTGECVAAISLAGPTLRMTDQKLEEIKPDLVAVGKTISLRLGAS
jgi:DNA-binding IclR family transcriptional regulator